jgi:hypothetical protein
MDYEFRKWGPYLEKDLFPGCHNVGGIMERMCGVKRSFVTLVDRVLKAAAR